MATASTPDENLVAADTGRLFDRPVFIMAAPRSCSTLLFQTLAQSTHLCSLGDESHRIFEGHPKLSPGRGFVDSNRLTADLYDPRLARSITSLLAAQLRDHQGRPIKLEAGQSVRMLEKTPKHALRIPFIDALFPDALFIYLFRDPRDNISSIIEAWRSGRFVTYRRFQTAHGPWSLLLPPGWRDEVDKPLEEIAAFQWHAANRQVIEDLARIAPERWTAINAAELLQDSSSAVRRLCEFIGVPMDQNLCSALEKPLPLSRFTLTAPSDQKWRRNGHLLARVWSQVCALVPDINCFVEGKAQPIAAGGTVALPSEMVSVATNAQVDIATARNRPCPCGSGMRYKQCHGRLS